MHSLIPPENVQFVDKQAKWHKLDFLFEQLNPRALNAGESSKRIKSSQD